MTPLTRPLVSLDVEATGPQPETDRVIELGLVVLRPDGSRERHRWLINPGCAIPAESTAIHKITDTMVALSPRFEEVAHEVGPMLRSVDLTGYNLRSFDLPILRREFERAGVPWPCDGARIYDSFVVFREHERHTLGSAVRRYLGRELVDAHSAVADAEAALDVALAQVDLYEDLRDLDLAALDIASGGRRPEWATECGRIRWDDVGDAFVAFGKHNGRPLRTLDRGFLAWVMRSDFPADVKAIVQRAMSGERVRRPAPPPPPGEWSFDDIPF